MDAQTREPTPIGAFKSWRAWLLSMLMVAFGLLSVGILSSHASGQSAESVRENVLLEGTHTDMQFLAGKSVRILANVADDVFAAGRDVTFESATVKNAIAAGYDVELRGGTASDMIAAGANIKVGGTVKDDLVAAGGSIRISTNGKIGGDARLAAETIDMEGRIGGSMRAAAARVTITGEILGKADFLAERIVIAPGAHIAGDLIYRSESEPEIAEGAKIGGEIRRIKIDTPDLKSFGIGILGIGLFIGLSWAIATLILIIVIQLAFPGLMAGATSQLQGNPWANLGRGIAGLLLASVLAGFLFASVLGIPIAVAIVIAIASLKLLGLVTVSYGIGLFIKRRGRRSGDIPLAGRVGWTIVGAIVLGVIVLIPVLGGIVVALTIAAGFGSTAAELWKRLRTA